MIKVKFKDGSEETFQYAIEWEISGDNDDFIELLDHKEKPLAIINLNEIRLIKK